MARGYSLHLGLNSVDPAHYDGWAGRLNAGENDARDMAQIAQSMGFIDRRVYLTGKATSEQLIDDMLEFAQTLEEEDLLLLTYSGHGGQIPDEASDEDDRYDETWCLYDRQLIDGELHRLFNRFRKGVRIVVLADSCHSGTVVKLRRDAGLLPLSVFANQMAQVGHDSPTTLSAAPSRAAPIEVTVAAYNGQRRSYLALQAASTGARDIEPRAGVIRMSGCMDDQLSLDGKSNGLFTSNLKRVWNDGAFAGGYRLFHQTIVSRMPPTQTPSFMTAGDVRAAFLNSKPFSI
jgi:hypothetical protein